MPKKKKPKIVEDTWTGCYRKGWSSTGLLTSTSFSHPAKGGFGLAERIYAHIVEEGWAKLGMSVIDPFGGIAGFGFHAMVHGLHFLGVELEPRFVAFANGYECDGTQCESCKAEGGLLAGQNEPHHVNGNLDLWRVKGLKGTARLIQGDSRFLLRVLEEAEIVVSSPPFAESLGSTDQKFRAEGLGQGAGRYAQNRSAESVGRLTADYGSTTGNLGNLLATEEGFQSSLVASSPPFSLDQPCHSQTSAIKDYKAFTRGDGTKRDHVMRSPGNLDSLPLTEEGFNASLIVSSPPYAQALGNAANYADPEKADSDASRDIMQVKARASAEKTYGSTNGNLGQMSPNGFDLAISSPPYAESLKPETEDQTARKQARIARSKTIKDGRRLEKPSPGEAALGGGYGQEPGQIGSLKDEGFSLSISSPPFADSDTKPTAMGIGKPTRANGDSAGRNKGDYEYGESDGNLGQLKSEGFETSLVISSPPYTADSEPHGDLRPNGTPRQQAQERIRLKESENDGQLSCLKDSGFGLAISSPPYAESLASDDPVRRGGLFRDSRRANDKTLTAEYGTSDGQIGVLVDKGFDAVISSPPWEKGAEGGLRAEKFKDPDGFAMKMVEFDARNGRRHARSVEAARKQFERDNNRIYGDATGNVGNETGETFWSAARQIVEEVYKVLQPGGHAVWVVKGYIRSKTYVDFPDQWRRLCEAVGFQTLHWHNASLIEDYGTQLTLEGGEKRQTVKRASFFRRLSEKNGAPPIDAEIVLCMQKPKR